MRDYRLGLYEKAMPLELDWITRLNSVKEAGFDYLEISIDETEIRLARLDWSETDIIEVSEAIRLTGVPIHSICLSAHRKYPLGSHDAKTTEKALIIMEKALILANRLGARFIQLAGYDVYYETSDVGTQERFSKNLKKCVEMAARYGILLGFETMETPFMDTVAKAMKYVTDNNSCFLQVYPDLGNLTNASLIYDTDILADIKLGIGHYLAAHLKETEPGVYRDMYYGNGHVDFRPAIECFKSMGVRMYVAEFWYKEPSDWKQICKDSSNFLRKELDSVYRTE